MKKIVGLLIVIAMIVSLIPVMTSASDSGTCGDNLTWTLNNGTLTISGTGDMYDYEYFYSRGDGRAPWIGQLAQIQSIVIKNGVTSVGNNAFGNCYYVTNVSIADTVTKIGMRAFQRCKIDEVKLPNKLTLLEEYAFSMTSIKTVSIPGSVEEIASNTFWQCNSLTDVTLNSGTTNICVNAFSFCPALERVLLPNGLKTIESSAFSNASIKSIDIPATVSEFDGAFSGNPLEAINVDSKNNYYTSVDGVLYNKNITKLIDYPSKKQNNSYQVPNTVEEIGSSAFSWSENIKSIVLPASVRTIGNYAFSHCSSLEDINIPAGVTKIGDYAFSETNIKSITIPGTVTELGSQLFYRTTSLENAEFEYGITQIPWSTFCDCSNLKNVSLPAGVTEIGAYAFADCQNLSSIRIPASLTTIKNAAFTNCYNLKDVYYESTEEQWDKITIDTYEGYDGGDYYVSNSAIINATKHYNTGGFPVPAIYEITSVTNNNNGTYTVTSAVSDIPYDCVIVAALYDENGLTGIQSAQLSATELSKEIVVKADNSTSAKVFIWGSLSSMRPLCEAKATTIK